jgi:hypothetical protein
MSDGDGEETIQHRHYWGHGAICLGCGVRRCRKWHCNEPREDGTALCSAHAASSADRPEAARPVQGPLAVAARVLTYSLPGACREELR